MGKHWAVLLSVALVSVLLVSGLSRAAPTEETVSAEETVTVLSQLSQQAVSSEQCIECHDDKLASIQQTYHGAVEGACLACHGEQAAGHIQSLEETGEPGPMVSPLRQASSAVTETCLQCHERRRQANFKGGVHDRRDLSCISCHSVHDFKSTKAQLKTVQDSETCFTCHKDIRALSLRTSHHPVREGKMGCASCHDPHDSTSPKMLSVAWTNEKCYECHTEKRGPFLWEHAPVRENCLNCHNPHGSNHDKLLVMRLPYLCQRCHLNTRHPGTLYDARNTLDGTSPSNRALEHACKNCHQNVHGSNSPSGPYLGR
jgi:DmsE family decaheme c-type cytochrome